MHTVHLLCYKVKLPNLMLKTRPEQLLKVLYLPTNITLGWKGLPETTTIAYYKNLQVTAIKSFIVQALGVLFNALKSVMV